MRFQTRLLFRYSLLILFLVVVLGITFYAYTAKLFENNAAETFQLLSSRISLHLDNLVRQMDFVTTVLISDRNFRTGLLFLATLDRRNPQNFPYINEGAQSIRSSLMTYSIEKNFYSVVVVTRRGDFFSSNFLDHSQINSETLPLSSLAGFTQAEAAHGRPVLVAPHIDPWNLREHTWVYGLARIVPGPGGDLAFIDVQNPISQLNDLFTVPDKDHVRILALKRDGSVFYESGPTSPSLVSYYRNATAGPAEKPQFRRNALTGKSELVISAQSAYTGIRVILVLSREALLRPLGFVGGATAGVGFLIILVSILYNWIASAQLTKPLRVMRRRMEDTELSDLPGQDALEHENDEVAALDQSFQRLKARLDEAIKRELKSHTLWLQARLDSLQAQVNPHFLYNILTVIASKGLELGDEEIGEMCDAIAAMLRYSTSTADRFSTLAEELDHVRTYLFLMKMRFEEQLSFTIEVDPEILQIAMPKIVLQQIVENSINHAYRDLPKPMQIAIRGFRTGNEWMVELRDNGQGFDDELLDRLHLQMTAIAARPNNGEEEPGMKIGGLGLLNTYTRLHLFYGGEFVWRMENMPGGGARVVIGGAFARSDRGSADVRGSARRG